MPRFFASVDGGHYHPSNFLRGHWPHQFRNSGQCPTLEIWNVRPCGVPQNFCRVCCSMGPNNWHFIVSLRKNFRKYGARIVLWDPIFFEKISPKFDKFSEGAERAFSENFRKFFKKLSHENAIKFCLKNWFYFKNDFMWNSLKVNLLFFKFLVDFLPSSKNCHLKMQ